MRGSRGRSRVEKLIDDSDLGVHPLRAVVLHSRVRVGHRSAEGWVWLWLLIEFGSGIGHPVIALMRGAYFPGVVTAPVLLALSAYLAARMWRIERHPRSAV